MRARSMTTMTRVRFWTVVFESGCVGGMVMPGRML